TGPRDFAFATGGPAIRSSIPREGSEWIDEAQAFVLALDAEPTDESVRRHGGLAVGGFPRRWGCRLLGGEDPRAILKARLAEPPRGPVLVIQAVQRFPNGARVILVWGKGVAAESGVATGQDQSLHFKVRDPFTVLLECERENKNAGCIPISPVRVRFSASVPMEQARRLVLIGPDGRQWAPRFDAADSPWAGSLSFKGPFPENAELRLEVPAALGDRKSTRL